ncbi:MAG TPA: tRNA pseudouridine(38-40) synthase TruA [Zoogloea sp.]|uniref:tRNA pseudouridine(38-40) synthase TruA n=1 Tax=Zoogloea sp. TaxID=49181 RepID=UPI002C449B4F|nr:tRNA pseudouridine(38-40) synthase TruA [Zoogloea sp.]HOB45547.1 tRNA pseudouridine(38-40) synthase TruA [Zoogloea sp.]HQA08866.1 tRNA pseudouridine(38-40) synthase TruA [Zoogloea sp.]HQE38454.1 tRNA pseudouridine(38-40) synthase TruA [Zoogloea sp.]
MRVAIGIEYAGNAFQGWQTQSHGRTVQDVVERALTQIAQEPVKLICAGRTDTGVHATMQVAHFDTDARRPLEAWVRGVNSHLPTSVAVLWAVAVDDEFHARFSAEARRYRYVLLNRRIRPGLLNGRVGWTHGPLDEEAMAAAAGCLVGKHDFTSFRAAECQAKSPVRVMHSVVVRRQGDIVLFDFHANAFLHHMIRNLVGSLVFIGKGRRPVEWMGELLAERNRTLAAPTFSPDGLYLCGVDYPPRWSLPDGGRIIAAPQLLLP